MDINSWLAILGVFLAVIALVSKNERNIFQLTCSRLMMRLFVLNLTLLMPILFYFRSISERCTWFNVFTVSWGFEPENLAFGLFYLSLVGLFIDHRYGIRKRHAAKVPFFNELFKSQPSTETFTLFNKYVSEKSIENGWDGYKELIMNKQFLNFQIKLKPHTVVGYLKSVTTEEDLRSLLLTVMKSDESIYHTELKAHWNSFSLEGGYPFLNELIGLKVGKYLKLDLLSVIQEVMIIDAQSNANQDSQYLRTYLDPTHRNSKGFHLPFYNHLKFVELLYSSLIEQSIEVDEIGNNRSHKMSLLSEPLQILASYLPKVNNADLGENDSEAHWLFAQTLDLHKTWLRLYSGDLKESKPKNIPTSTLSFVIHSNIQCVSLLYKATDQQRIRDRHFLSWICHDLWKSYFDYAEDSEIKSLFEENITWLSDDHNILTGLNSSLNQCFGIALHDLKKENCTNVKSDLEKLNRVKSFLLSLIDNMSKANA